MISGQLLVVSRQLLVTYTHWPPVTNHRPLLNRHLDLFEDFVDDSLRSHLPQPGLRLENDAVTQGIRGEDLDIVGCYIVPALDGGEGLTASKQAYRGPGTGAQFHVGWQRVACTNRTT